LFETEKNFIVAVSLL